MTNIIIMLCLLVFLWPVNLAQDRGPAERAVESLGPDEGDQSKIIMKHSIVYHFVKNVKAIESDIFVSRKIDIGSIVRGISEIADASDRVSNLCREIPSIIRNVNLKIEEKAKNLPKFKFISQAGKASHVEARQRCRAHKLELPEIYNPTEMREFQKFLETNKIFTAHAGIYFDEDYSIQRFYTTGMPIWQAYQAKIHQYSATKTPRIELTKWESVQDKADARFFYTATGDLVTYYEDTPTSKGYFRSPDYRTYYKKQNEFATYVVCQVPWDGNNFIGGGYPKNPPVGWDVGIIYVPEKDILSKHKRAASTSAANQTVNEGSPLEQW